MYSDLKITAFWDVTPSRRH